MGCLVIGTFSDGMFSDGMISDGTFSDRMFSDGTLSDGMFCDGTIWMRTRKTLLFLKGPIVFNLDQQIFTMISCSLSWPAVFYLD